MNRRLILTFPFILSGKAQDASDETDRTPGDKNGRAWLSWSKIERLIYIDAFLAGVDQGAVLTLNYKGEKDASEIKSQSQDIQGLFFNQ